MCLAVPMRLLSRDGDRGEVDLDGIRLQVSLALVPEAVPGDHLIVHAGIAIETLRSDEAEETLRLLRELAGREEDLRP